MSNYLICAYYTDSYTEIAHKYLISSLNKLHLESFIEKIPNTSWNKATDYKPHFAKKCLEQTNRDIVLIDVDAIINSYPNLFDELNDFDFAGHWMKDSLYIYNGKNVTLLSGTLFLKNNNIVKSMVNKWIENVKLIHPEQKALEETVKSFPNLKILNLPREYCYIETLVNGNKPLIPVTYPVISHYQASRKMRNK